MNGTLYLCLHESHNRNGAELLVFSFVHPLCDQLDSFILALQRSICSKLSALRFPLSKNEHPHAKYKASLNQRIGEVMWNKKSYTQYRFQTSFRLKFFISIFRIFAITSLFKLGMKQNILLFCSFKMIFKGAIF